MGHEAWHMIGRTPGHIVAVRPLRGGAITDFEITQRLIRLIFARAGITRLQRARVLVCVPSAITHVEQRAVLEATRRAGAAQTYLIEQPMAAAIGAVAADPRAAREHGHRHRRRHERDGGDLARRDRRAAGGARRLASTSTRASRPTCGATTASRSVSALRRRSSSRSAPRTRPPTSTRPRCAAATS